MRQPITPGRLYARMSTDFRRQRRCAWCRLPLPQLVTREDEDAPNWELGAFVSGCKPCERLIHMLVTEYQERYDLHDPVAVPRARMPVASMLPRH